MNSTTMMTGLAAWFAAPLALMACGTGAAPDGYRPPIATLRATVGGGDGDGAPNPDLRLALVWISGLTEDGFPRRVAQDVAWRRVAPATYEIAITERPPAEVLQDGPVTGNLLAYHDLNHNHRLDFATVEDTAFIDTLVAFDADLSIEYNEVDGDGEITVNHGMPATTPITLYGSPAPRMSCHLLDWIPRSAFEAGRRLFDHDLDVGPWRYDVIYSFPDCGRDALPPSAERLACAPFDYYVSWGAQTSEFIANTCGPVIRHCERTRPETEPAPPGWPCPCDPAKVACAVGNLDI